MAAYYDLDGKKYVPKSRGGEVTVQGALIQNPTKTVSGAVVHFTDGADMPAESVIVNIEPVQSGTGTPSPDNVRPISGWDSVNVTRSGKNLYSRENSEYNVPVYAQDGTQAPYPDVAVWWIKVKPNTKYTCSLKQAPSTSTYIRWINCDKDKGFISRLVSLYSASDLPITITTPNNTEWAQIAVNEYPTAQISQNDWELQIEESATATAYEPYQADTYTTDLGRTVYGGSLDVVNGVLTVDRARITLGNVNEVKTSGTGTGKYVSWNVGVTLKRNGVVVCDKMKGITFAQRGAAYECYQGNAESVYLQAFVPSDATVQSVNDALSGSIAIVTLAEPRTIQLTPKQVTTLLGTNNVWADSGDVDLTYRRDINIVLDELTQAIISLGGNV